MQIAICEDDEAQAGRLEELLKKRLSRTDSESIIDVYFSSEDMKRGIKNKKYEKKLKKLFGNRKPEALGNEAVSYHEIINQISHY